MFLIAVDQFVQWIKHRSRKVFTNRDPIQSKKNAHCPTIMVVAVCVGASRVPGACSPKREE